MALYNFCHCYKRPIAITIKELKYTTSKLQTTALLNIIKHALYHQITPKFANVKGQFLHTGDKWKRKNLYLEVV